MDFLAKPILILSPPASGGQAGSVELKKAMQVAKAESPHWCAWIRFELHDRCRAVVQRKGARLPK